MKHLGEVNTIGEAWISFLKEVDKKRAEAQEQLKRYAESYKNEGKKVITAVFVADNEKRQIVL